MKLPKARFLRRLLWWMEERQRIYHARVSGQPVPWTRDPILQRYRFCCTYRELDKVTQWIRENWRQPYANHPNLWFAMCIARQINWPDTLAEIGFPEEWNPRRVLHILEKRKQRGEQIYSGAYILGGGITTAGMSKVRYTVMHVLNPVWRRFVKYGEFELPWTFEGHRTLQDTFEWLCTFHGFGRFLAYEVVTDLRHTRYLSKALDVQTWANVGPGARRGLNRLYERELNASKPQQLLLDELLTVLDWVDANRNLRWLPTLEPRDVEHSLCEYDKYCRARERLAAGQTVGLERFTGARLV